jgi:acyl-CoA synthetase (AMP-forming)/AMP-acid ligase II
MFKRLCSPYPPIAAPPYPPLPQFITQDWVKPNTDHIRNKVAIIDGSTGQSRSFQEYHQTMVAIASYLKQELHVNPGSTLALFSPNHVDYIPISLAAAMCGCKLTPIDALYKPRELATILHMSSTSVIFVHATILAVLQEAMVLLNQQWPSHKLPHIIIIPYPEKVHEDDEEKLYPGTISLDQLKKYPLTWNRPIITPSLHDITNSPFLLPYSSGTTGLLKAVCLSHQNIIANLLQLDEIESMPFPSVRTSDYSYMESKIPSHYTFFSIGSSIDYSTSLLPTFWFHCLCLVCCLERTRTNHNVTTI